MIYYLFTIQLNFIFLSLLINKVNKTNYLTLRVKELGFQIISIFSKLIFESNLFI